MLFLSDAIEPNEEPYLSPFTPQTLEQTIADPTSWICWPWLALRRGDGPEPEWGVMLDAFHIANDCFITGYSCTVILENYFDIPQTATVLEILQLPQENYDTPAEVVAAGWRLGTAEDLQEWTSL